MTHVSGKSKEVDGTPPPQAKTKSEYWDYWMGFKQAGFSDSATMEEKDFQALLHEKASLEQKLYDSEHNMGLILAENKELNAKVKELSEAVSEREEVISCNEAEHLIALSEAEKREDNMRKFLDFEKRCCADLSKALREIGEENEKIKLSSQTALDDANNLVAAVEDLSSEADRKMQEADAKLATANAKSMELDRRFQEIETRERMVMNERFFFNEERKRWEVEDMSEWERRFHKEEELLCEGQQIVTLSEEKVIEMEMTLTRKEKELEDLQTSIGLNSSELKKKEDDLNNRLANLIAKEMEAESIKRNLEMKEEELLDLAENLDKKEKVEIQKLVDAHKDALNSKQHEFDLEVEEKRKSIEEDMRSKVEVVDKKESEIEHREEKLRKQEQAFEQKMERFKQKENDLDTKLKALKEKEKSINTDTKKIELDQKQILADKEILKDDIEKFKTKNTERELKLREDEEKLKITEDERTTLAHLQSELKEEINKCRIQSELLEKKADDMRKERMKFEEEWMKLDVMKTEITKEKRQVGEEKETLEKLLKSEEARLEKEIKRKLEVLEKENESFSATMKQEQSLLIKNAENKLKQLLHELELKAQALEVNLEAKRLQIENQREEFANERSHFLSIVEKLKNCGKCGELTNDLQMLEGRGDSPLSTTVDENNQSPSSLSLVSWLRKSVTNFKLSPHQNNIIENVPGQSSETLNESQQPELRSRRTKRSHDQTCLGSGNDIVVSDSEVGCESVTKGGRKKTRQTTPARFNKPGDADTVGEDDTDSESGHDVEEQDLDQVSLGKKLWTFFST